MIAIAIEDTESLNRSLDELCTYRRSGLTASDNLPVPLAASSLSLDTGRQSAMSLLSAEAAIRKRHGKHYTPERLADFLAQRMWSTLTPRNGVIRILDPACGDGELLLAMERTRTGVSAGVELQLVGYDIDPEAIELAKERAAALGLDVEFECQDFLIASDALSAESFDGMITNPPYVRTQQLGGPVAQLLAEKYGLSGRIDLTHPFVSIAPRVLKPDGVLSLLCSNRFLSTKSGANMREVFNSTLTPVELFDLGDTKMFGAAVLPAIVIAVKRDNSAERNSALFMTVYESSEQSADVELFDALTTGVAAHARWDGRLFDVKAGTLEQGGHGSVPWRMGGTDEEVWFRSLHLGTWKTFGEIAKIRVGIKTTADTVFIGDSWETLPLSVRPEAEVILPLTTHHNIAKWRFEPGKLSVLYPYRLDRERRTVVDMDQYPRSMAYLESHRSRLESRKYVVDGGREWFEIWVPQKPSYWSRPKLVFPDISELPRFALDRSGAVVNGDCYWISVDEIGSDDLALLMLGVANSSTAVRFYDHVCGNKLYAGRRRWISQYVSRFPVPNPNSASSVEIVRLVRSFLEASSTPSLESINRLDELVAKAFSSDHAADDRLF